MDIKADDYSVGFDRGLAGLPTLVIISVVVISMVARAYTLRSVVR